MRNRQTVNTLQAHIPLSSADRKMKYLEIKGAMLQRAMRIATAVAIALPLLVVLFGVSAANDLITWKAAAIWMGSLTVVIGVGREISNMVGRNRVYFWSDQNQELSAEEASEVDALIRKLPELGGVVDMWMVYTEKLSLIELGLLKEYAHESQGLRLPASNLSKE